MISVEDAIDRAHKLFRRAGLDSASPEQLALLGKRFGYQGERMLPENLVGQFLSELASMTTPMGRGGFGRLTRPALFLAGEKGPEDFAFSGSHRRFGGHNEASDGKFDELTKRMERRDRELPDKIAIGVRDALVLAGVGR